MNNFFDCIMLTPAVSSLTNAGVKAGPRQKRCSHSEEGSTLVIALNKSSQVYFDFMVFNPSNYK